MLKQINKKIINRFFSSLKNGNLYEWYMWIKTIKDMRMNGYNGDLNDYNAIIYYEEMVGNEPVITNVNGNITYTYIDGLSVIRPGFTLSSVFPDKEAEEKVLKQTIR